MKDTPFLIGGVSYSFLGLPFAEWAAIATVLYALIRIIAWLPEAGKSIYTFYSWSKRKLKTLFGKPL